MTLCELCVECPHDGCIHTSAPLQLSPEGALGCMSRFPSNYIMSFYPGNVGRLRMQSWDPGGGGCRLCPQGLKKGKRGRLWARWPGCVRVCRQTQHWPGCFKNIWFPRPIVGFVPWRITHYRIGTIHLICFLPAIVCFLAVALRSVWGSLHVRTNSSHGLCVQSSQGKPRLHLRAHVDTAHHFLVSPACRHAWESTTPHHCTERTGNCGNDGL